MLYTSEHVHYAMTNAQNLHSRPASQTHSVKQR